MESNIHMVEKIPKRISVFSRASCSILRLPMLASYCLVRRSSALLVGVSYSRVYCSPKEKKRLLYAFSFGPLSRYCLQWWL